MASLALVLKFNAMGYFTVPLTLATAIRGCGICSLVAAVVESLPLQEIDNLTIPLAVAAVAQVAF